MKLPLREAEQGALLVELDQWDGYVSSALLGVETIRACARYGEGYATEARSFLMDMALLPLDDTVLAMATDLGARALRGLDALHLATALSVRDEIGVFIAYDQRLADAAEAEGLSVSSPT